MNTAPSPSAAPTFSCVLWDVDGTLVDASVGIMRRLRRTLAHFDIQLPDTPELSAWIGPPLLDTFRGHVGLDEARADEAITLYRAVTAEEGFAAGARLFDGVLEVVQAVHAAGIPQATASSKSENQVVHLMEHFGVAPYLDVTVGAGPDVRLLGSKEQVVAEALRRLDAQGADTSRPVLIGDRHHDVEGAAALGVPTIFVSWGFSEDGEERGSLAVAHTPRALERRLLG